MHDKQRRSEFTCKKLCLTFSSILQDAEWEMSKCCDVSYLLENSFNGSQELLLILLNF